MSPALARRVVVDTLRGADGAAARGRAGTERTIALLVAVGHLVAQCLFAAKPQRCGARIGAGHQCQARQAGNGQRRYGTAERAPTAC